MNTARYIQAKVGEPYHQKLQHSGHGTAPARHHGYDFIAVFRLPSSGGWRDDRGFCRVHVMPIDYRRVSGDKFLLSRDSLVYDTCAGHLIVR